MPPEPGSWWGATASANFPVDVCAAFDLPEAPDDDPLGKEPVAGA